MIPSTGEIPCRRFGKEVADMQQLALPLPTDPVAETALRRAWIASRLRLPFHVAINTPAIAIGLRHMAAAEQRRPHAAQSKS